MDKSEAQELWFWQTNQFQK